MTITADNVQILVIDDESQIRKLLRFTLEDAGYVVREAETGRGGLQEATHALPDVIILDLGLPDLSGTEVLTQLRKWTMTPVLILSVLAHEGSKIAGLDAGADDYLTKPFTGGELLARIRSLLRRVKGANPAFSVRFGQVEVDLVKRRVFRDGMIVKLTGREYDLLHMLVSNRDKILTHGQLLRELWGPEGDGQTHYLRIFMMRLRRKLEEDPDSPKYLQTESGVGYRLVVEGV
jgi:two-component system KDP operon response regulator KdpE